MVNNTISTKDIVEMNAKKSVMTTLNAQALNGTKRRSVRYGFINRITSGLNGLKGQKDLTVTGGETSGAFRLTTIEGALMPAVASNTLLSRLLNNYFWGIVPKLSLMSFELMSWQFEGF